MDIQLLLSRWFNDEITEEEFKLLIDWYAGGNNINGELNLFLETQWQSIGHENSYTPKEAQRLFEHTINHKEQKEVPVFKLPRPGKVIKRFNIVRVAVVVGILFCIGIALNHFYNKGSGGEYKPFANSDAAPGSNKAFLTLADGSNVLLDSAGKKMLQQGAVTVRQSGKGELEYLGKGAVSENTAYNTLTTPRGGKFEVKLPDGSRAWLNSASSIRYPVMFSGAERLVEVSGEVYLEVVHNEKMPFKIRTNHSLIEDIGTEMNIYDYSDEAVSAITLISGSIKIATNGKSNVLATPGQQSVLNNHGPYISQADIEEVSAWKNGYFLFNNEDIQSIMRKLSRWYNIDVEYQGEVSKEKCSGSISMQRNISSVLNMLSYSRSVHFKISGHKVTVMP